jgi:hypothetical protein
MARFHKDCLLHQKDEVRTYFLENWYAIIQCTVTYFVYYKNYLIISSSLKFQLLTPSVTA